MALFTRAFEKRELRDPGVFRAIFSNVWLAPILMLLRLYIGYQFLMAGSASINPLMFVVAMVVIFGWKTAGWIGLDRWLLPALGTPWQPGPAFKSLFRPRVVNEACPVCEMPVEMGRSPTSVYNGLTYLSCCPVCKEHLDAEPTRYLAPAAGMP